jgi:BlaI family penicillinase repressor
MARRKAGPERPQSRREREIMDIVYALGEASAAEVRDALVDAPSYSAVRGLIRILEDKGHLKHRRVGRKNLYAPTRPPAAAGRSALQRTLSTFFGGDLRQAVVALFDAADQRLPPEDVERIEKLIDNARKEGR